MSPTVRRSLRAAVIAATGIALVVQGTAAADPLTDPLFKFYGNVTDPIGRGVAVASVSDGAKSVQTASSGAYELGERDFNKTYRLVASKAGMETVTKDVAVGAPLDTRVDFTLQYRTTASIVRRYLSTTDSPASTTVNIQTYAPNPGLPGQAGGASCVKVTDSGTGSQTNATYASTSPDGAANWVWSLTLAAATPERSGTLTVRTVDCATGTVLSRDTAVTYVVDNTAPAIRNVFPADGTMSAFGTSQQAGASFKDTGGAGIDTSTIGVTVTDTVTGATRVYTGGQVSYNATTGQATAGPMTLAADHRHRVDVTVKDRAGNTTTFGHRTAEQGGGFTTVTATLPAVTVRVPKVDCDLGDTDLYTQTRSVSCRGVKLHVDGSTVKLSQATHAGSGFRNLNTPLNGISLVLEQATGNTTSYPYSGTKFTTLKFGTPEASASEVTMTTAPTVLDLQNLDQQVKAPLATKAYLILNDTAVNAPLQGCAGSSVVAGSAFCLSDPLHTIIDVTVKSGQDAAAVAAAQAAQHGFEVLGTGDKSYGAIIPDASLAAVRADSRILEISREMPFSFAVPAAEVAKHDITDTPAGQQALASNSGVLGIGTCVGTVRVLNMSTAAGLPATGDPSYVFWPVGQPLPDIALLPTGGNGFTVALPQVTAETGTAMAASSCDGGSWVRSGSNSCPAGTHNGVAYGTCQTIFWLSNDNFADRDFYTIDSKVSGRSTTSGKWMRYIGSETVGDQAKQAMKWEDYDPISDVRGPCKSVQVSISAAGVGLSGDLWSVCELWDVTIFYNEPGHNMNVWRGDVSAHTTRGAEHMGTVSIPVSAGQRYISWKPFVHACASWTFPGCW